MLESQHKALEFEEQLLKSCRPHPEQAWTLLQCCNSQKRRSVCCAVSNCHSSRHAIPLLTRTGYTHVSAQSLSPRRALTQTLQHAWQCVNSHAAAADTASSLFSDPSFQRAGTGLPPIRKDLGLLHIAGEGIAWGERPGCNIPHIRRR